MESSKGRAVAPAVPVAAQAMTVGSVLTVAGILLIFVLLALVLVFLQYYFNARDDRRRTSSPSGTAVIHNDRGRGVPPEVLRSLPVTVYRAAKDSTEEEVECAVCLAELEDGEEARFLPRCGHGFHAECVDLWLASHSTCPLCRLTVGKPDVSPAPLLAALPPVPPEPANYAVNLPASVLLGVSNQGALTAVTMTEESDDPSPSAATMDVLVIEIPESSALATPHDVAAKSPGSARLRSLRRLWSFGRPGPATPSCSCASSSGEGANVEKGVSVTVGICTVKAPPLPPEAAARAPPRDAARCSA